MFEEEKAHLKGIDARFEADKLVISSGIHSPFWGWWKAQLEQEKQNAITVLTSVVPTIDNLGQIAAAQERLRFATELLNRPAIYLGNVEPR